MKKSKSLLSRCLAMLVLGLLSIGAFAQPREVRGTVTDINGDPMVGVNVLEKGTTNGVVTDLDGKYALRVATAEPVLVFSFIGFIGSEETVGTRQVIDVTMNEDRQNLDEVVVIGYGTARKIDITGAVTRADMTALENSPNVNVLQALKGTVPGLNIGIATTAGGSPSITIRGTNTISGSTEPLIVMDGVIYRGSLSDINTADVESIDVLKDASSTAIYGSQAANGVLLITTKMAKEPSKPIVEYATSFSYQTLLNKSMKRLDKEGFSQQIKDIYLSESRMGESMTTENPNFDPTTKFRNERAISGYLAGVDTDWWDLLTVDVPYIMNHNLSVRGKNDKSSYFASFGYTDQKNLVYNDTFRRYNARVNLDTEITDWMKLGGQAYFNVSDLSGENTTFGDLFSIPACVSPYDDDGALATYPYMTTLNPLLSKDNPDVNKRYNMSANVYADISIPWIEGLSYRVNFANDWIITNQYNFDPYDNNLQGVASKNYGNLKEMQFDNILTYKRQFGQHSVNATLVYGVEKREYESTSTTAKTFTDMSLGYNNMGLAQQDLNVIGSSAWAESSLYGMARLVYSYADRYILTGTIRRDGFSGFGENNKFGYFPSAAIAWRVSEENFVKDNVGWLDNLKLRLSYGSNGNRTAGRYSTMASMANQSNFSSAKGYIFGDGATAELLQLMKTLSNPDLKWETTNSVNFGIDFGFLRGRLFGTYDFYVSNTRDLLYNINIPLMNGMVTNSIPTNIGKLRNVGHEISITGIPVQKNDFQWTVTANFSRNRNKVITILGADENGDGVEDDLIASNIFIGQPLNTIYSYNYIGMWQLSDYYAGNIPTGFYYGTYKVEDINGDGRITAANDRKIIGYRDPAYRLSIQNTFTYKNWTLNVFVNAIQGGKKYYLGQPASGMQIPDHLTNNSFMKFDYWTPENPNARYRQLGAYNTTIGVGGSPYVSRSFIRLQELSLSYSIPRTFLRKVGMQSARIYVSGNNLFTITDWDGWDPEAGQGLSYSIGGYPTMKNYTVGLNLSF